MDAAKQDKALVMIFLSYPGDHSVEAELLQFAYETLLADINAKVWTYERDQAKEEKAIAESLKSRIKASKAMVFLVTPSTLDKGAAQWMELAYADAFGVPTFILLHRLSYQELKTREAGVPPLLLAAQCNSSKQWREIVEGLRQYCSDGR
jgi:hypothetical protein